jgi:adenylylsulfate kinase
VLTVWLTGLPAAGKTTIATALTDRLRAGGSAVEHLDGDVIRTQVSRGLTFSRDDREENMRRVGWIANLLSRNGVFAVCSLVSPYRSVRDELRALHGDRFFEVYVATPLEVCMERDPKGLYARQRAGQLKGLTGVDDPYEPPLDPELVLRTDCQTVAEAGSTLWKAISERLARV